MKLLVDRFGRTGAAALTSLMWALPMAAWAGSADLSPIDKTAYPWIALAIGVVMLVAWLVVVVRIARTEPEAPGRRRRLDLAQMSSTERRWALATFAFACGAVAWLNAAATVDWSPLLTATAQGKPGPSVFAAALALFLLVMLAGVAISWRRWSRGFAHRR
jgi:Na+/melibiose symporter-like transporter